MEVMRDVQIQGCACFGVDAASLMSLNGNDGAVYLGRKGDRAYVLKFLPLENEAALTRLQEKTAFMAFLAENGVGVIAPLPSQAGLRVERVQGADGAQFGVSLTAKVNGVHVESNRPEWGADFFHLYGRTMGRMHALAKQYPAWRRDEPDEVAFCTPTDAHLSDWRMEFASFVKLSAGMDTAVQQAWQDLRAPFSALPTPREGYGLVHNDLHLWNMLYEDGQIHILDFDCMAYHWYMQDIAIAVFHPLMQDGRASQAEYTAFARGFLPAFRSGYEQENQLGSFWWGQLNLFLKHHAVLLYIAMSASWSQEERNPWQEQFLARLRHGALSNQPMLAEEMLRE